MVGSSAHPAQPIDLLAMEAGAIRPGYELWRPNREKPEAKSARAVVVFLLLVTALLLVVVPVVLRVLRNRRREDAPAPT